MTTATLTRVPALLSDSRSHAGWVLAVTGIAGFWIGMAGFPTWAIPVETAQVVAGIVTYPPDNPFYIYHTKLWTIVIQLCALLLRAGVSEMTLSLAISGVLAMVSFQALGIVTYAVSRSALVAIAAPFLVVATGISDHGVVYPVMLFKTHHTYGAIGLSTFVLAVGLLGAGWLRTGAFLLGIAPAVHPSIGIWVGVVVVLALLWDRSLLRGRVRAVLPSFIAGAAITAVSLIVQLTLIYDVPRVDAATTARYVHAFVTLWDDHRKPVHPLQMGVILNAMALATSLIWLRMRSADLEPSTKFLLRTVAIAAALGLAFVFITWVPPDRLPATVIMLMPARILNFNVMVFVPVAIGLLARARPPLGALLAAAVLGALAIVEPASHLRLLEIATAIAVVAAFMSPRRAPAQHWSWRVAGFVTGVAVLAVGATAAMPLLRATTQESVLHDRTNDPFFAAIAAERDGVVVTAGSFQLVQLYTRRPVLIDSGGLDTVMYAPESAPALERVLRDVYGIEFFDPPRIARGAVIPHDLCRYVWSGFSRDRWRQIRKNYNVTQVVTRRNYELDLPIAAENPYFKLYRIPE